MGRAMAEALIAMGKSVIIVGLTEAGLKKTAAEIGAKAYFVLDVSNISAISGFVRDVLSQHPELDCVINNAGVQKPFQILGPDYGFDLKTADQEIDTNIRGPLHLSVCLVPHFNSLPNGGVIMNVSSVLGYNPVSLINPIYNGTKEWVHFFTMNLSRNFARPVARSRLWRSCLQLLKRVFIGTAKNPEDNKKSGGNSSALSIPEFIKQVKEGWQNDQDICTAGLGHDLVENGTGRTERLTLKQEDECCMQRPLALKPQPILDSQVLP